MRDERRTIGECLEVRGLRLGGGLIAARMERVEKESREIARKEMC